MSHLDLSDQLVVAISSRALFDFEEENTVFETANDKAYMQLQLERLEQPAKAGVARTERAAAMAARVNLFMARLHLVGLKFGKPFVPAQ